MNRWQKLNRWGQVLATFGIVFMIAGSYGDNVILFLQGWFTLWVITLD